MNEFDETDREQKTTFVDYDTTISIDCKNLKQEINQSVRRTAIGMKSNCLEWNTLLMHKK